MYTLTDAVLDGELSDEIESWIKTKLRNHIYPPEFHRFMYMLQCKNASDDELLAILPPRTLEKSTLHSDAGPAFIGLDK